MRRGVGVDSFFWKLTPNGVFDVRSFYNSLSAPPTISFSWKCIWSSKVPKRVSFFLWIAAQDSILTIDNLVKRNLHLVNSCCLCRCDGETVDHLLLYCKFANALWSEVFLMFGIQWVMPRMVVSLLCAWENYLGIHSSSIWNMVPACLMWLIWRKRNTCTFEDVEKSIDLLKSLLVGTLFGWSRIWDFTMYFRIWFSAICFWFFVIFFKIFFYNNFNYSLFFIVNVMYFLLMKYLLPI